MYLISNPLTVLRCLGRAMQDSDATDHNPVSGFLCRPGTHAPPVEPHAPITEYSEGLRLPSCPGPDSGDCSQNAKGRRSTDAADVDVDRWMLRDDEDQTPAIASGSYAASGWAPITTDALPQPLLGKCVLGSATCEMDNRPTRK